MNPRVFISLLAFGSFVASSCSGPTTATTTSVATQMEDTVQSASTVMEREVVNVWVGPPVDTSRLPIGTERVSLSEASVGGLFACDAGNSNGGGAHLAGPWLDEENGTWDLSQKVVVRGDVAWPMATYSEVVTGDRRIFTSNGLPVGYVTGVFPIASDDPAYSFDRNPHAIAEQVTSIEVPVQPKAASAPTCLGKGLIGVLKNGVALFAPLDERNRDAVAYETQDVCDGHPQQTSLYHYHDVPSCLRNAAFGPSTVVGYALDGFPIVVERDAQGNLPSNEDLDECHGRVSTINIDGELVEMYHYSATFEFPYILGCYRGTVSS